jgi:hypothetical protein
MRFINPFHSRTPRRGYSGEWPRASADHIKASEGKKLYCFGFKYGCGSIRGL